MIWHLKYEIDKEAHLKYFWENYTRGAWHEYNEPRMIWWKIFHIDEMADPVIKDLNLEGLNIIPRYSYQFRNTRLLPHIDIDNIVGVNLNLMPHPITIHFNAKPYSYNAVVADVGKYEHSVEPVNYDRLVLKLAVRAPIEEVLERLNEDNHLY